MNYARQERLALCDLLAELGGDRPTLCEGWRTADLAAHLVLRERRPDAAAGVLGGPLARYTRSVQSGIAARTPFPRLIELIRTGPPRLSPLGLPGVDERANTVEFFVHHEDVRRAQPGWAPRDLDPGLSEQLWHRLGMARLILRHAPVGVELARGDAGPAGDKVRVTVRARTPVVTVTGTAAELTMWTMGRTGAAGVELDGSDAAVAALRAFTWRL
ncbi:MAG TPA: TIGR03085 family metal-binding protein [Streptosporangiaceae bacterium]|nr:TIGR03085 family metal-binding protein [Streptosporangiaceae bacterium]